MNKQKIFATVVTLCVLSVFSIKAQEERKYDYIASGYYQLVYDADIAHLEENDNLAFAKLQEAEKRCPLINTLFYDEIELYCHLLIKNRQYEKAFSYMDTLATNYGYFPCVVFGDFEKDTIFFKDFLANPDFYDVVHFYSEKDTVLSKDFLSKNPDFYNVLFPNLLAKSKSFYTHERDSLTTVLKEMCENDQKVRVGWEDKKTFDAKKMQQTDSINYDKILQIIEIYGFPNEKLYGRRGQNILLSFRLQAMFVHSFESQKLQEMLIKFVREGKCSPNLYGLFVDRRMLDEHKKYIFGTYTNVKDDRIFDIEYLDKRRMSIGMPTREMERKRNELIDGK